jgi:multidrug resistance efflux pump
MFDAQQKVYDSRQELFKPGALPRKDLDQAGSALRKRELNTSWQKRHLDSLNAVVKQQDNTTNSDTPSVDSML